MTIKIVTDSCSDITQDEAKSLGITVVPAYLYFGNKVYRDGVDIDCDEFYRKLTTGSVHPSTAAPSPGDFAKAYQEAAKETDQIVSIHVTRRHSGVYDSALVGKEIAKDNGYKVEVVDSQGVTMWQGIVAIVAAQAARAGCSLQQVLAKVHSTISQLHAIALLDTLRYAVKGGRLGNTIFALESKLNIKPLITLVNGEIRPAGLARSRLKGIERLRHFISTREIDDLAIVHSTSADEAQSLANYGRSLFPKLIPKIARLGPALGVHGGPGVLVVVTRNAK